MSISPLERPTFSAVIPAYNMEAYIGDCLRSVLAQSDGDFEAIVVDDGSTDRTAQIVRDFTDPRVRLIQRPNGGLAAARNSGVAAAAGRFVAFLDADDRWCRGKLAAHRRVLESQPGVSVSYDWSAFIDKEGRRTGLTMSQARLTITCEALLLKNYLGNGSTAVVRREVLEAVGGFDEKLRRYVDHELWVRLAVAGHRFQLIPEVLTEYRVHPASFTADSERMLRGLEAFLEKIATYSPESVRTLAPLARACTRRWMARAAFVAGNYPEARRHARAALLLAPSVLWRDRRAAITFAAILAQTAMPKSLFNWSFNRLRTGLGASLLLAALLAPASQAQQAVSAAPATVELSVEKNDDAYLLGPGDRLKIAVYSYDDMSGEQTILPDGRINLPLAGAITVANLSLEDATAKITERLVPYINRPQVALSVVTPRSLRVSVVGEVNQPGPQLLSLQGTLNNFNNPNMTAPTAATTVLTMSRALVAAKGITQKADLSNIELHRHRSDGSVRVTRYDLWQTLMGKADFVDPVLQDGDTVVVSKLPAGSDQKPLVSLRSSIAADRISIAVGGEVRNPGEVRIAASQSALDAIANAGGATDAADLSAVTLLRQQDGQMQSQVLNLDAARQGNSEQNPILMAGDSLIVPRSGWRNFLDTFGRILSPLNGLINLLFFFRH